MSGLPIVLPIVSSSLGRRAWSGLDSGAFAPTTVYVMGVFS
jgi:hypothetical protein